jgi:hypothetical protein
MLSLLLVQHGKATRSSGESSDEQQVKHSNA